MNLDTTPQADRERTAALRRLSGHERLAQALELSQAVRMLAALGSEDRSKGRPEAT